MTLEEAKRDILYGGHTYDELTEVQRDYIDYFWEEMIRRMAEIFCTRPYKASIKFCGTSDLAVDFSKVDPPPKNYREEHNQLIERIINEKHN